MEYNETVISSIQIATLESPPVLSFLFETESTVLASKFMKYSLKLTFDQMIIRWVCFVSLGFYSLLNIHTLLCTSSYFSPFPSLAPGCLTTNKSCWNRRRRTRSLFRPTDVAVLVLKFSTNYKRRLRRTG